MGLASTAAIVRSTWAGTSLPEAPSSAAQRIAAINLFMQLGYEEIGEVLALRCNAPFDFAQPFDYAQPFDFAQDDKGVAPFDCAQGDKGGALRLRSG